MLTGLDLAVFLGLVLAIMGVGLSAARRSETTEEYFLAGRSLRWWWIAGSMFGTNVSANHLVGMLGVGFSIGFAQSHFELGAVFALLALAYVLLPVYAHSGIVTLSQYLGLRYDERVSLLYSVTTLLIITVQLTALFYIGSRSMDTLLRDSALQPGYVGGVVLMAVITATYTIVGGMRAVVWTDALQSVLLLVAGVLVAVATFSQPEIGGLGGLLERDAALPAAQQRMHLYLPSDHPDLPWTGVFTGLMLMHVSFWGTNQTIVQRTLAARSLEEARFGILAGGFLKLSVPFFSIAGGVAAAHLFDARLPGAAVAPDEAFPMLMTLVVPAGFGLMGWVAAGLLGAILSTIDSNLNSASALVCVDLYEKHLNPEATERQSLRVSRLVVVALVASAALLAITTHDPNSRGNFFLDVSRRISYLTPGLMVAFVMGMFSARASTRGAVAAIVAGPFLGVAFEWAYEALATAPQVSALFGEQLNFMHRTFLVVIACVAVQGVAGRSTAGPPAAASLLFTRVTGIAAGDLSSLAGRGALYLLVNAALAGCVAAGWLPPVAAGIVAAITCLAIFAEYALRSRPRPAPAPSAIDDRILAGILVASATFVLFCFP